MKKILNNKNSVKSFISALKSLPGGVDSPVRAFGGVEMNPLFIERAKGSKIFDVDGNCFIDYVGSWGPMILGHAHPKVVKAVQNAAQKGTSFGAPTDSETHLARKIINAFPSIEKVRLVCSGTEAVMTAVRLARAYTNRDMIVKMSGCYHGHSDSFLVAAGSGVAEMSKPSSDGVPQSLAKLTIVVPYNDIDALNKAFKLYKNKIAAVLVEPVAANMGVVAPLKNYLSNLRTICTKNKSLLIFDEIITGFRIAYGGAQQLYKIKADITCLGKIIGGGLPLAAFGARAEIMNLLAPLGPVYQAGTLSGNPLATAAANQTLELLKNKANYKKLENLSARLEKGFLLAAEKNNIPVTINRVGSIMSIFFTDKPVANFADVKSCDAARFKKFFSLMLQQGIYLAPSAYEAMFVSLAHTQMDIDKTITAAQKAFQKLT